MVYKWLKSLQSLAYPPRCVLCLASGQAGINLCTGCQADLPWQTQACRCCALTLNATAQPGALCPACQKKPSEFSAAWALLRYQRPVDWLVTQLKFHAQLSHAQLFATLMAGRLSAHPGFSLPQAIIPVPLHKQRWRERGFNQATEIAKPLGRTLGIPVLTQACQRVLATAHQADLPAHKRRSNVRGAFSVRHQPGLRHVAIVDDVVTTGATATALARALKSNGVDRVQLWCAARA